MLNGYYSRLAGTSLAEGSIYVFLDSHCECYPNWLSPLIHQVTCDRTSIAIPIIDAIAENDFNYNYTHTDDIMKGGFDWSLNFKWEKRQSQEDDSNLNEPFISPSMPGGIFAIQSNWFYEIGSFDSKMETLGGENIDLSLRTWLCYGSLYIIPCSHVGHVFRTSPPYKTPARLVLTMTGIQ